MSRARVVLLVVAALLTATALLALRPAGEPGCFARDFEAYYSAGATWNHGGNPYSTDIWKAEERVPGVVSARRELLPYIGLPSSLPLFSIFARFPYMTAARMWEALLCASLLAILFSLRALLNLRASMLFSVVVFLASFVPVTSDFGLGQAAVIAYAGSLVALAAMETRPMLAWAGMLLASLQPNVALQLVVGFSRRRAAYVLAASALTLYAAGAWGAGLAWPLTYLRDLGAHGAAERFASIQITPAAIAYGFGLSPGIAKTVGIISAAVFGALALIAIVRGKSLVQRAAIACAALPFVAGFFHVHDDVVLLLPIFATLVVARGRFAVAAVLGACLSSVNWLDFGQQPQAVTQDVLLAVAAFAGAASFKPSRAAVLAGSVFAVFVAFGAWVGHTHPVPIWPNDMAGAPSLAQSAAAVWKEEQLRSGLLTPGTAAALLRCFTLLGSALVLFVTLNIDVHDVVERVD